MALVIGFMRDADRGVREMARVTHPKGTVAICMWDIAGDGMTAGQAVIIPGGAVHQIVAVNDEPLRI